VIRLRRFFHCFINDSIVVVVVQFRLFTFFATAKLGTPASFQERRITFSKICTTSSSTNVESSIPTFPRIRRSWEIKGEKSELSGTILSPPRERVEVVIQKQLLLLPRVDLHANFHAQKLFLGIGGIFLGTQAR
jgi:hypothetical protein